MTLKNSSHATLRTNAYTYDNASRVLTNTVDAVTTTYGYDDIGQLESESRGGYSASYTYDGNGNRLTRTVNSVTEDYAYDDADKLQTVKIGGVTQKSYGYDTAGRTTSVVSSAGTTTLDYDYEGRIATITYPSTATNTFTYNGLDTRVGKVDSAGTATYKRDGAGVIAPVLSDGGAVYTPGISEKRSSTTTFLHSGLKNADSQTGTGQTVAATKQYDAFGNTLTSTGTWQGPFGYAGSFGYQEDADSSLKLLGHRYYDASTGRFLTRDPVKDGRNWYTYCENDVTGSVDRKGLAKVEIWYKSVARTPGYHAFIIVTDEETGKQYYFRGGIDPKFGWNEIKFESGEYVEGTPDWLPPGNGNRDNTVLVIDDDKPAQHYIDKFNERGQDIEDGDARYVAGPFNLIDNAGNSNSLANDLLKNAGLKGPKKHPVWVPWWDSPLRGKSGK